MAYHTPRMHHAPRTTHHAPRTTRTTHSLIVPFKPPRSGRMSLVLSRQMLTVYVLLLLAQIAYVEKQAIADEDDQHTGDGAAAAGGGGASTTGDFVLASLCSGKALHSVVSHDELLGPDKPKGSGGATLMLGQVRARSVAHCVVVANAVCFREKTFCFVLFSQFALCDEQFYVMISLQCFVCSSVESQV
jgi:hypothetical protein